MFDLRVSGSHKVVRVRKTPDARSVMLPLVVSQLTRPLGLEASTNCTYVFATCLLLYLSADMHDVI